MPTIKLTDQFGLDETIQLPPTATLLSYFQQLRSLKLDNLDFSKVAGLTLDQPAVRSLSAGLSFVNDIPLGSGPELSVNAGSHASLALVGGAGGLPESAGDVDEPEDASYVSFAVEASAGLGAESAAGALRFGAEPGTRLCMTNYHPFPRKQGVTLLDAVRQTVGSFVAPVKVDDLAALPAGCLATVSASGTLTLSVTANLLALSNPLASVSLPAPLPALSVGAGGSMQVGARYEIECDYEICSRKLESGKVQLGWLRRDSKEVAVHAKLSESVSAGLGSTDLFSKVVTLISANPIADLQELKQAGLPDDQTSAIQGAVKAAISRKLELSLFAELSKALSHTTVFQYEIDLAQLTADSRKAVNQALHGDLTGLHLPNQPGIRCLNSIWENCRERGMELHVNLLGIFNFRSIATLTRSGKVLYEPATGSLVITDSASAERIKTAQVNYGASTEKLRGVMAESFLLTTVYQGAQHIQGGPTLHCRHSFFSLDNKTSAEEMAHKLRTGVALGLFSNADTTLPPGVEDFGRTLVHAATEYSDSLVQGLFLDSNGAPFSQSFYEQMGRNAIAYLVNETDVDSIRRKPAMDDTLWRQMKDAGQANFAALFPGLAAPLLGAVTADYSTIVWWAEAMAGAGERLASLRLWASRNPGSSSSNPAFQRLREDLAGYMKKVAATTREEFGQPWGLIAMSEAAHRRAGATILIAGPKLARTKTRALAAVTGPST